MKAESGDRHFLRSLVTAILLSFAWVGGAAAAIEAFTLPGALPASDDDSAAAPIGFPINFGGVTYTELFVNNNGNVTFGAPVFSLAGIRQTIIAPFLADVDTRAPGSGIVRFGTPPGRPDLFVVDWIQVGYFDQHDDKLNSFQLILQDLSAAPGFVPGDFRIILNYDRIQWETGDASGGINGLGGGSAAVGFSNGSGQPGTFFLLPGSGRNGFLLDGGERSLVGGKIPLSDPSVPLGRYQFVVRNGVVAQADLAIAADIAEDEDELGFELVVRNFGPSDATEVDVGFSLRTGRITAVRPRGPCRREGKTMVSCLFPVIGAQQSRRIRITADDTSPRARAEVASTTFDSDLSNNVVRANTSCRGQILSQTVPESVLYEPTATGPARQSLRLAITNIGDERIEIRRIRPLADQPFQVGRVRPQLPETVGPGKDKVFRVETFLSGDSPPAAIAQRPYFRLQIRCPD